SLPLDRTLAGSSAFSFGSSATEETTSWFGIAVELAEGAAAAALLAGGALAAPEVAAAGAELLDELQPARTSAPPAARAAVAARMRGRRAGCLSVITELSFQVRVHSQVVRQGSSLPSGTGSAWSRGQSSARRAQHTGRGGLTRRRPGTRGRAGGSGW